MQERLQNRLPAVAKSVTGGWDMVVKQFLAGINPLKAVWGHTEAGGRADDHSKGVPSP